VLRAVATLAYDMGHPFARVPVLEHLRPVFVAGIGAVHSSGVQTDFSNYINDPFFGITDQRTGLSYGGGITLEVPIVNRASVTGTFNVWRDALYGGQLWDTDNVFGLAWHF
jgi:hypothetical protein